MKTLMNKLLWLLPAKDWLINLALVVWLLIFLFIAATTLYLTFSAQ